MCEADIAAALECDVDIVHQSIPASDIHLQHKLQQSRVRALAFIHLRRQGSESARAYLAKVQ